MKFTVTLSALRENNACFEGYNRVVRALQGEAFTEEDANRESYLSFAHDEPISLLSILESNGLGDALWALYCVPDIDRDARLYTVWCARKVQHLMTDPRSLNALDVAERFANGQATAEELDAAGDAARAAWDAAWAAWATAWAARAAAGAAARDAAWDAARDAARDAQKEMFIAMCEGRAPWQGERK